ncbi:hypothetical protein HU761_23520 [Pseudomonas sp. SWRI59]|uniref:hypothetical protein n=1 Tax=unclassified Pseudomonas TaxID=196821 RepID=UPI001648AF41|nr:MULTISPECIES: hypothetical protein [unclassified Pseudomonas]MBC3504357.1 hypothetical protein [Pseudomonas sp. SWRI59]MBC3509668.1 hypothetical protein [Pseudomonas sp. SWRI68]
MSTPCISPTALQESLRLRISEAHTRVIEGNVYDRVTGEWYGEYISQPYTPEPTIYVAGTPAILGENWFAEDNGTVSLLQTLDTSTQVPVLAPVIELLPQETLPEARSSSTRGPKPQIIYNPIAPALCILNIEQRSTPWLDDIAFGAIHTGPGVINGKQSVSLGDVMRVLRLPIITTAAIADRLLNHDRKPMCTRQIQRVVEAARIALRGIALYLERHPHIVQSLDISIEFDKLWRTGDYHTEPTKNTEHPMKQAALMMMRSKVQKRTIAKELGISKNTVKKWYREIDIELGTGGQPAPINDR